jgi:hypothetical protein
VRFWGGFPHAASIKTIGAQNHYLRFIANQNGSCARGLLLMRYAPPAGCNARRWPPVDAVKDSLRGKEECVWVRPEVVAQVEFLEWTGPIT